ncbi:RNA polymerase sigma factor [Sorangium sp. So ce1504]|uniref:RNA polymerase sigma factor n=1 Tax=Sorangium sp. So ce1504 TaxID=3133337 RepID=UPI003F608FFE
MEREGAAAPSDAELAARLRRRDPRAFDELYARYHPRIFSFLVRLSGRRDVAEDLFQDTWLAVARHAGRLAEDTDLAAWLFTIARNRYRSHRRSALLDLARAALFSREPAPAAPEPEGTADARADVAALEAALRDLAAVHREVLLLGAVEGLDTAQVAQVLGIREDAARKRLSRARAELAARLERRNAERPRRGSTTSISAADAADAMDGQTRGGSR